MPNRRRLSINRGGGLNIPPSNEIWYISSDGEIIDTDTGEVNNKIAVQTGNLTISNTYINGIGKIIFEKPITSLRLLNVPRLISIWIPKNMLKINTTGNEDYLLYKGLYGDLNAITKFENGGLVGWNIEDEINLPNLYQVNQYAFMNSKFTKIIVPKLISIPNSLSYGRFFANGNYLTYLDIRSVESIGEYAINNCKSLNTLILGEIIPTVGTYNFANSPLTNIYVPDNKVDAYKADSYWSTYASSIKPYSTIPK